MSLATYHLRSLFGGCIPIDTVLAGVASGMAKKGVRVIVDPACEIPQAHIKKRLIMLPAVVRSEKALAIVRGWLDHEAGHIIHTPWEPEDYVLEGYPKTKAAMLEIAPELKELPDKVVQQLSKLPFSLWNAGEDARSEKKMTQTFPGSLENFRSAAIASDVFNENMKQFEEYGADMSPYRIAGVHILMTLSNGIYGLYPKDLVRRHVHPDLLWLCDLVDENYGHIRDISRVDSRELRYLADATAEVIVRKFFEMPEVVEIPGESGEEGEEDSGEEDSGEEDSGEEDSGEEDSGEEDSGEEDSGEEATVKKLRDWTEGCTGKNEDIAEALRDPDGLPGDIESKSRTHLADSEFEGDMPSGYFDKLCPGVTTLEFGGKELHAGDVKYNSLSRIQEYASRIRNYSPAELGPVSRLFVGKFRASYGLSFMGNRISPRKLLAIKSGLLSPYEPFMLKRNESVYTKQGIVVSLLIDCSGSMGGYFGTEDGHRLSRIEAAHAATLSLAKLLAALGVKFEVLGFTTRTKKHHEVRPGYSHSRGEDNMFLIFKSFSELWATQELAMLSLRENNKVHVGEEGFLHLFQNADGEAVLWAAMRLLPRQEDKKVLIVLSDGEPATLGNSGLQSAFLKWVVKAVQDTRILIGGLGLGDGATVEKYYPVSVSVKHSKSGAVTDLREGIIKLVSKLLSFGTEA